MDDDEPLPEELSIVLVEVDDADLDSRLAQMVDLAVDMLDDMPDEGVQRGLADLGITKNADLFPYYKLAIKVLETQTALGNDAFYFHKLGEARVSLGEYLERELMAAPVADPETVAQVIGLYNEGIKAIDTAISLSGGNPLSIDYQTLGRAYAGIADNVTGEEREDYLLQVVEAFRTSCDIATDHVNSAYLANALYDSAEASILPAEILELKKEALEFYRISHRIEEDLGILETIRELERDLAF